MTTSPPRKKIGLAIVKALPPDTTIWDTDIKGFCIRRQKSEAVSYLLKLRVDGRIRWLTIGRHGQPWTPDTARKQALRLLADPGLADTPEPVTPPTFARVAELFLIDHGTHLKPKSLVDYSGHIRNYLLPAFGHQPITEITYAAVSTASIQWKKDHPRAANYALAVLSKIMTWAERQEMRPRNTNPCRGIQRARENKRQTFLQPPEIARLGAALDKAEAQNLVSTYAIAALRLLFLLGARMSEILTLQWCQIDFSRGLIFLTDSKTGPKTITLNAAAVAVLEKLPRFANNPYVIVGRRGEHMVNLHKPWDIVRKLANLPKLRIHDLRHTFSSVAVASGGSLPVLGRQLGHSQPATTQRYAHLADDPVRKLTEETGTTIAAALRAMPPPPPAEASFADFYAETKAFE